MKTASKIFWSALLGVLSLSMPAQAVPQVLGYQGRLVNADGTADSKVQKFRFSVWDLETAGVKKWEETQDIGLTNGFYSTYLGQVTAFPTTLFDGSDRYLQVSLIDAANNEEILTPRQRVGSVAYALRAGTAQSVAGGGTVDATTVTVNGQPALTSVSATAPITGGGTATSPLALGPCASGEILKWSGTAWACATDLNGSGTVTTVTASAPLTSSGGTAPNLTISAAGTAASGYLTSTDWNTFNNKVGSVSGTAPIVSSGGIAPAISILPATPLTPGAMSAADKAKLDGITAGAAVASVGATGPVASSGGANPVISMPKATSAVDGYLAALDWTTFNNKLATVTHDASLTGNGTVASALGIKSCLIGGQILKWNATTSVWDCMADNNSGGTVTSVGMGTGLIGGPITAAGTVSIDTAVVPRLGVANIFTTGAQTIQTGAATNKGLLVQGAATQSANLQEWQNSAGAALASVSSTGVISGAGFSGPGAGLTGLNASNLASGTVPLAQLGGITTAQLSATAGVTNGQLANSSVTVIPGTGLTGGGAAALGGSVTLNVGMVPPANGGTGINTSIVAAGSILQTAAVGSWATLPPGATGQVLTVSVGGLPAWATPSGGTVTSVTATGPLASSGSGTAPNISLTACPVNQILKYSGTTWACAPDDNTTYTAGTGLVLSAGTFSVGPGSNNYIQNQSAASQSASFAIAGTGVIGSSLAVAGDAFIGASAVANSLGRLYAQGAVPPTGTGTLTSAAGSTAVSGTGTLFTSELRPGDTLVVGALSAVVASIANNLSLTVVAPFSSPLTASAFTIAKPLARMADSAGATQLVVTGQGSLGIGIAAPGAKLDVAGDGHFLGVKKVDGVTSTYSYTTKHYHVEATAPTVGNTNPLDMTIVDELCRDEDGCEFVLGMRSWAPTELGNTVSIAPHRLFLSTTSNNHWASSYTAGSSYADANSVVNHIAVAWGCVFTDGEYVGGSGTDTVRQLGLMFSPAVTGYGSGDPNTTVCTLDIRD